MAVRLGFLTLRKRIVIVFTCGTLIPFFLTVLISYLTISSIQTNQIRARIQSNLSEVQLNMENALDNLNHVSQQLALQGYIGTLLNQYLTTSDAFEKSTLRDKITSEISLVSYTNPNVGLLMYIFDGGARRDFESSPTRNSFSLAALPLLVKHYQISYFGPHQSSLLFTDRIVLSVLRKVDIPGQEGIGVYLETGFKLAEKILNAGDTGPKVRYLFLGGDRRVAWSEVPKTFPWGKFLPSTTGNAARQGFLWNEVLSRQGWTLVSLVDEKDFNLEKERWLGAIFFLFLVFAVVAVLLGSLLWEMIYKPMGVFQKEMTSIEDLDSEVSIVPVHIPEFDRLLFQFQDMKERIRRLLAEGQAKERHRADLEIEKLLFQINPHFLLNALNTVHWLAVNHDQPEIDKFSVSLSKLLSYNLGKLGKLGTIRGEIEALKEYVAMQSVRFDLHFHTRILVDDRLLDTPLPRFTLQPLVENAIFHGLGDDGSVFLELKEENGLVLTIEDHGPGITAEQSQALVESLPGEERRLGMGIGLNYVKRILEYHYEGKARLEILGEKGKGTRIVIVLPLGTGGTSW